MTTNSQTPPSRNQADPITRLIDGAWPAGPIDGLTASTQNALEQLRTEIAAAVPRVRGARPPGLLNVGLAAKRSIIELVDAVRHSLRDVVAAPPAGLLELLDDVADGALGLLRAAANEQRGTRPKRTA
jgi:hypothetical protein